MTEKRAFRAVLVVALAAMALGGSAAASASSPRMLTFSTMVGVPAGLTGAQSQVPLRGINGGGLPWTLASGTGRLSTSGHLEVEVKGLVLAAGANAGSNPIASFRALVSCVRDDGTFANILTDAAPATIGPATAGGGNAEIEADITLPHPCIAPIVFVTSPTGSWFASTGN
jgi:hypothetical protein